MKITTYDRQNDIIYIEVSNDTILKQVCSEDQNVIVDLNKEGNIVGIEMFNAGKLFEDLTLSIADLDIREKKDSEEGMCECKGKGHIGLMPCPFCNSEYFK